MFDANLYIGALAFAEASISVIFVEIFPPLTNIPAYIEVLLVFNNNSLLSANVDAEVSVTV